VLIVKNDRETGGALIAQPEVLATMWMPCSHRNFEVEHSALPQIAKRRVTKRIQAFRQHEKLLLRNETPV
jgi:hypothetical protein